MGTEFMNEVSCLKDDWTASYITSLFMLLVRVPLRQWGHLGCRAAVVNYASLHPWSSCSGHPAHFSPVPTERVILGPPHFLNKPDSSPFLSTCSVPRIARFLLLKLKKLLKSPQPGRAPGPDGFLLALIKPLLTK